MSLLNFFSILIIISTLFLGVFLFFHRRRNRAVISFGLLTFSVAFWAFANFMADIARSVPSALFWSRVTLIGATGVFALLPYFSYVFIGKDRKLSFFRKLFYFLPPLIFISFTFTPFNIQQVKIFAGRPSEPTLGGLYIFFAVYILAALIYSYYTLLKNYKKLANIKRGQIHYITFGTFIAVLGGVIFDIVLPLMGESNLVSVGPFFAIFFLASTSYAIIRYRLMDIRVVVKRTGLYMLLAGFAYGAFYFFIWLFNTLFGSVYAPSAFILGGILAFVFVFCFFWFEKGIRALANQYFFTGLYSQQEALKKLSQEISTILDLDKLVDTVCEVIKPALGLDKIAVVLRKSDNKDHYALYTTIGFKRDNGLSLLKHNVLTEKLEQTRKPIVYQEAGMKGLQGLKKDMKRIEAQVCLPLVVENQLEGIIILGKKLSGNPYTKQDLELLDIIANQASVALQNARLYGRVQDLSENLQEKVEQQTEKLRQTLQELRQLNATKTEFVSMASHQLRTPLTAVQGYASMILEGDYGKIPSKMKGPVKNIFKGSKRLIKIVDDLLDVSQIELGQMKLEKEPTDIQDLLEGCRQEMNKRAQEEDLNLIYKQKDRVLPKINIDKDKIRQVILNIIDNAIHYTEKGKIEIEAEQKEKAIVIKIKDTGAGLTEKDKIELFEGFAKGTAGRKFFIQSTGLGLYVARKFILLHNGKIWADSPGKGKGSIFYVQLPLGD